MKMQWYVGINYISMFWGLWSLKVILLGGYVINTPLIPVFQDASQSHAVFRVHTAKNALNLIIFAFSSSFNHIPRNVGVMTRIWEHRLKSTPYPLPLLA